MRDSPRMSSCDRPKIRKVHRGDTSNQQEDDNAQEEKKVTRSTRISFECHPDLFMEDIFDELNMNEDLHHTTTVDHPVMAALLDNLCGEDDDDVDLDDDDDDDDGVVDPFAALLRQ